MVSNNLYFFDRNGDSINLQINPDTNAWEGTIYFDQLSLSLFDNENLFILEKVGSDYKFPTLSPGQSIEIKWDDTIDDVFFLYDVTKEVKLDGYFLDKKTSVTIHYDDILPTSDGSNIDIKLPLQVNIAFNPNAETEFRRTLKIYLKDDTSPSSPELLAKISLYGEGENEDDRFRVWLQNFGIIFNKVDANILAEYDIKEAFPDYKQLNESRKAILVNHQEIYPYIGTYKGLVNFIDMLGYKDALHIQEYWKNVNKNSQYYEKLFLVDLKDILDDGKIDNLNLVNLNKNLKSGKQFSKTEFLALTYEFTKATDNYDDDGIPEVVETTEFGVDEIFYKLNLMSKKLKNEIIPVNVIIKDIIGEFVYFQKISIKYWRDDSHILDYNLNEISDIKILCDPDSSERLTLMALDPLYKQEYELGVKLGVVQFNEGLPDPYEFAQYYGAPDIPGIINYIETFYNTIKDERYPDIGAQLSWDFGDDPDKKIGAPIVLDMNIEKFTFETFRGITWKDLDSLIPSVPKYWTLQNLDFRNIYEITWHITKPTPNPYNFKYRGKAIDLYKLPHFLPFAGEYTVHLYFHTFNGDTIPYTKKVIVDDAKKPEIIAFSRLEDKFDYRINNLDNIRLQDFGASTFYYPRVNVLDNEDVNFDIYKNVLEWESFFQNRYGTGKNIYDVDIYDTITQSYVPYNDPLQNNPKQDYWGLGSYTTPFKLKDFEGMTFDDAYFMRLSDLIYQGDFNAGFYMTTPKKGDTITISLYSPFVLPSFSSLQNLADQLNASDHPGIRLYNYEVINEKIHAQAEYFSKEMYHILYMPCPGTSPGNAPLPPTEDLYITYSVGIGKQVNKLVNLKGDWIDITPTFPGGNPFSVLDSNEYNVTYADVKADPNDPTKVVVCGTHDIVGSPEEDFGAGIRVSHDAGETWFQPGGDWLDVINPDVSPASSWCKEGNPCIIFTRAWYLNSNVIYVISSLGDILKSTDGGLTFNIASHIPREINSQPCKLWLVNLDTCIHAVEGPTSNTNDDVVVVGIENKIYKSSDGGYTWTLLNTLYLDPLVECTAVGSPEPVHTLNDVFISKDQQTIIALGVNGDIESSPWTPEGGVYKSIDGGITFNITYDIAGDWVGSPALFYWPWRMTWNPSHDGNIDHFWVTCFGVEGVAYGSDNIIHSSDGGDTWITTHHPSTLPVAGTDIRAAFSAAFHSATDGFIGGTKQGGMLDEPAIRRTWDAGVTLINEPNQVPYIISLWLGMWTSFRKGSSGGGSPLSPGCQKGDKYTFFHPRDTYSKRLVDYLKTTFPPFDEETLFLFAKTSDMISGAVQDPYFWVDTDYWRWKDDRQRGFLPTTIDENAFSITKIKMFNERFEIPRYAPMFFIIDNLDAKKEFIWTLIDQITGEEVIRVKGVPFFVWKFKDLGKFTLSVQVIDTANTSYYQTLENLITVSDKISYTKNIERKLNDRKLKVLSS